MVKVSGKADALREIRIAAMYAFELSGGGRRTYNREEHQCAIADLAFAQLRAFELGATKAEVDDAGQWG